MVEVAPSDRYRFELRYLHQVCRHVHFRYYRCLLSLIDLWNLLDIKRPRGASPCSDSVKHFAARGFALLVIPFFFYLFWFQVHFAILTRSGPGDDFMTPEFQETLSDNP